MEKMQITQYISDENGDKVKRNKEESVNNTKIQLEIAINLNTFFYFLFGILFESFIIFIIVDMEFGTHCHNRAVYGSNKIRLVQFSKTSNLIFFKAS